MIQDDIISELQYIPENKLIELYDIIHYFRLSLTKETVKQEIEEDFKIDEQACLEALAKIKRGDKSSFTEIGSVKDYIINLRNEIN
jgi:uncharacterized protein YehS (DUF1456 family)